MISDTRGIGREHYKHYAVKALATEGKHDEAITLAGSLRGPWTPDGAVNRLCERILLDAERVEEAYRRSWTPLAIAFGQQMRFAGEMATTS